MSMDDNDSLPAFTRIEYPFWRTDFVLARLINVGIFYLHSFVLMLHLKSVLFWG